MVSKSYYSFLCKIFIPGSNVIVSEAPKTEASLKWIIEKGRGKQKDLNILIYFRQYVVTNQLYQSKVTQARGEYA